MNSGTKEAPVSAILADHQIREALQKYARTARLLGREDKVEWALYIERNLNEEQSKKESALEESSDAEILEALKKYVNTTSIQRRAHNNILATASLQVFDWTGPDYVVKLERKLSESIAAVSARVDAVA